MTSKHLFITKILTLLSLFFSASSIWASSETLYAGIEVGSKGVKICILNTELNSTELSKKIVFDSTINSDYIKFSVPTNEATLKAILRLYDIATERYNIQKDRVFIAISSGVKQTADRDKKTQYIYNFINDVKIELKDMNREIEVISVYQESIFTHKSVIPTEENMTSIIIDIGSGNTKGGYFISQSVFNTFNIPWGTKSTFNFVEKLCDSTCTDDNFISTLQKKLTEISDVDIPYAVDKCGITNYDFKILFSGGIAWASSTLIKPEKIKDKKLELSYDDINKFYNQLNRNYEKTTSKDYSLDFLNEKSRIQKVFNQRSLIAGTGLLLRIMRKFERVNGTKQYVFIRDNKAGWLPAYIIDKIDNRK